MAKIKLQGHASGSGIITLTAPNTSTDRTITLPDGTGTLLNSDGSGASLTSLPNQKVNSNLIINGGFDVAQRGTTVSGIGSAKYTLDRWKATSSGADSTVTQVSGATYPKALRLTGAGSTSGTYLQQRVESANSRHLAGQTATFSVYLRASTAKTVEFSIGYASGGTDTFSGTTGIASANFSVTTTDTKFTWTGSIPSAATTGIQVELKISSQGSAWYEASNAKLETGSVATDFEHRSYGEELALCQRYYQKLTGSYAAYGQIANMNYNSASQAQTSLVYRTEMRAAPSLSYTSTSSNNSSSAYAIANGSSNSGAVDYIDTLLLYNPNTISTLLYTGNSAGGTAREAGNLYVNSTITELALVAELQENIMATYKYKQYINGVNDSVDVVFPADSNEIVITKNVPMNEENLDYVEILKQVADGDITIAEAD